MFCFDEEIVRLFFNKFKLLKFIKMIIFTLNDQDPVDNGEGTNRPYKVT